MNRPFFLRAAPVSINVPRLLLRYALALMDHPVGIAVAALIVIWIDLLVWA